MIAAMVAFVPVLAVVVAGVVLLTVRSWRAALRVLLDLLTAAGLLRLAGDLAWTDLAAAAAIIVLRRMLWGALAADDPARLSPAPGGQKDRHLPLPVGGDNGKNGRTVR
ncbi:hypothetical protein [Micromonospora endolithica]|uniref:hypothetical protein n=1 Tax=Micromonospora endolithica TaxID=230091 RepID=UPI0011AC9EBA|nr:hypothetical protein [Micromonospora endolithica]TWJ21773.1 hypothetical protein JD76_01885 [Micromonospora endolithica]